MTPGGRRRDRGSAPPRPPALSPAKHPPTDARRLAGRRIQDRQVLGKLFDEIAPRLAERPGGYTRVLKLGTRKGDAADMSLIELVD